MREKQAKKHEDEKPFTATLRLVDAKDFKNFLEFRIVGR